QAEDGIRDRNVTGVHTCALPILIVAEGFDYEIIKKIYKPFENLSILVTLKSDGNTEKTIVGSIAESLEMNSQNLKDYNRLKDIRSEERRVGKESRVEG